MVKRKSVSLLLCHIT